MKHHCNRDLFVSELNDLLNNPEIQRMAGYEQHQGNTTLQHVLNVAMVSFRIADRLGLDHFFYMGASHGAGVGWHLLWKHAERIRADPKQKGGKYHPQPYVAADTFSSAAVQRGSGCDDGG